MNAYVTRWLDDRARDMPTACDCTSRRLLMAARAYLGRDS